MNSTCQRCKSLHVPGGPQWKCCAVHTTEGGPDWVCDTCAVKLHPDKAGVVTHAMFNLEGILPCCDVSRYEVRETDRISMSADPSAVTCMGRKRYKEKA